MTYGADLYAFGVVLPVPGSRPAARLGQRVRRIRHERRARLGAFRLGVSRRAVGGWLRSRLRVRARLGARRAVADAEARRDGTEETAGVADKYSAGFDFRLFRFRCLGELAVDNHVFVGLTWSEMTASTFSGVYLGFGASPPQRR
jgi:hypothetical protein